MCGDGGLRRTGPFLQFAGLGSTPLAVGFDCPHLRPRSMPSALDSSVAIVGYLALFSAVAVVFVLANLVVGRFVRPSDPHAEKREIYECGEPTIGSSFVQFDLRFYVVALLFIIFDVEVALFFPWATVFGKASQLADGRLAVVETHDGQVQTTPAAEGLYRELGLPVETTVAAGATAEQLNADAKRDARRLMWTAVVDIGVFFAVLMAGFAYVWRRGDLDWVRAVARQRGSAQPRGEPAAVG